MTVKHPVPARLFVLLAREAPVGVILRRGPSEWVQLIKWQTNTDTFEPGQWVRAKMLPERCDLSPDGKLLVYFAHRGANSFYHPNYTDSWTAISKPPYFTALALWPLFSQDYGGGVFLSDRIVRLNHKHVLPAHEDHQSQGLEVIQDGTWFPGLGVLPERLRRDGWEALQTGQDVARRVNEHSPVLLQWQRPDYWTVKLDPPAIWYKRLGTYALEKRHFGYRAQRGEISQYTLIERRANQRFDLEKAKWADFDQQGRIVLAQDGKLFSAVILQRELVYTELADFNSHQPETVETPAWARSW